jgi:hypothetical protein
MTLNTKDLYLGNVGVGTTAPYQTVPATAIVNELGQIVSSGLEIPYHNEISMSYDGSDNLVGVAYSVNGVGVANLTLSYSGTNLISVVRS